MKNIVKTTRKIITEEFLKNALEVKKILLFGSRARKNFNEESDWDFLIIIDKELNRNIKWEIILKIKRKLSKLKIPNDIIINSENQIQKNKNNVGNIIYYALKDGIAV